MNDYDTCNGSSIDKISYVGSGKQKGGRCGVYTCNTGMSRGGFRLH